MTYPLFTIPDDSPNLLSLPPQKFNLGDWVCWSDEPQITDFGKVCGVLYTPATHTEIVGLHYLILLDEASPSRKIVAADFAYENDLELLTDEKLAQLRGYHAN